MLIVYYRKSEALALAEKHQNNYIGSGDRGQSLPVQASSKKLAVASEGGYSNFVHIHNR